MRLVDSAAQERWHVRYWATNNGRREGYHVMRESERNVSGQPLVNCKTREDAQRICDEHNTALASANRKVPR